jgi:hypothetical protein
MGTRNRYLRIDPRRGDETDAHARAVALANAAAKRAAEPEPIPEPGTDGDDWLSYKQHNRAHNSSRDDCA